MDTAGLAMVALCFAHGGRSMPEKGCSVGLHWAVVWPKVVSDSLGTPQSGVRDPTPLTDRTDGRRTDTVVGPKTL